MPRIKFQPAAGGAKVTVCATTADLPVSPADGDLSLFRIGTWPNQHEELLKYNSGASKWVGEEVTALTMNDTWALNLDNRTGTQLTDWSLLSWPVPYGKAYTTLNGAQAANSGTLTVGSTTGFTTAGNLNFRDNLVAYTGVTATTFTGCTLSSGTGGTMPSGTNIAQGYVGGYGTQPSVLPFVTEMWTAGLRLQEQLVGFFNGSSDSKALTIAPYWYEYNASDGSVAVAAPPTGGIGFSASLVGTTTAGASKPAERPFVWAANSWADWAAGTPTKRYMVPRLYGKMGAAATDTGEVVDATLRVRWVA